MEIEQLVQKICLITSHMFYSETNCIVSQGLKMRGAGALLLGKNQRQQEKRNQTKEMQKKIFFKSSEGRWGLKMGRSRPYLFEALQQAPLMSNLTEKFWHVY